MTPVSDNRQLQNCDSGWHGQDGIFFHTYYISSVFYNKFCLAPSATIFPIFCLLSLNRRYNSCLKVLCLVMDLNIFSIVVDDPENGSIIIPRSHPSNTMACLIMIPLMKKNALLRCIASLMLCLSMISQLDPLLSTGCYSRFALVLPSREEPVCTVAVAEPRVAL